MTIIRLRLKPIAWIAIEGIRPETLKEIAACTGCQHLLYTLDEYFQGRLSTPLIPPGFDALVHIPEHGRSHVVI